MKRKTLYLVIILLIVFIMPFTLLTRSYGDTGPKPSVVIDFKD